MSRSAWKEVLPPPGSPLSRVPARLNRARINMVTTSSRKDLDGLAGAGQERVAKGSIDRRTVIVFRWRKADQLKLIYWDGSGGVMVYKRFE